MTFRCQACKEVSQPRDPAFTFVFAQREKVYPFRPAANRDDHDDPGGQGVETVKELRVCLPCAELLEPVEDIPYEVTE